MLGPIGSIVAQPGLCGQPDGLVGRHHQCSIAQASVVASGLVSGNGDVLGALREPQASCPILDQCFIHIPGVVASVNL